MSHASSYQQAGTNANRACVAIHGLTDACFKKCVPAGGVKSATLDKYEEPCLKHCVDRLMDAQVLVWKQLEKMNATMG